MLFDIVLASVDVRINVDSTDGRVVLRRKIQDLFTSCGVGSIPTQCMLFFSKKVLIVLVIYFIEF